MNYVCIGKLIKPFGLKGEMKLEVYTDFIEERFAKGSSVFFYDGKDYLKFIVSTTRMHKGQLLVSFKGYEDINLIEKYRGLSVYKSKDDIKPLNEGEYYFDDLVNLELFDEDKRLGKVLKVEEGIKYNFLRVLKSDETTALVPFIERFIKEVDLKERKIYINHIEGLLWNLPSWLYLKRCTMVF